MTEGPKAQLLASGVAVPWALRAQELLAQDWGVSADVWSVTSWGELRRQADEVTQHNLLHPEERAADPLRHAAAAGDLRAGGRGVGLDARRPRPHRALRARAG